MFQTAKTNVDTGHLNVRICTEIGTQFNLIGNYRLVVTTVLMARKPRVMIVFQFLVQGRQQQLPLLLPMFLVIR